MITRIITIIAAGAVLSQWNKRRRERQFSADTHKRRAKPADETRWEGEGGALPVTGAQLGPEPARV